MLVVQNRRLSFVRKLPFFLLDSVKALVCWYWDPVVILLVRGEYRIFFFLFVRLTSEQLEANFVVDLWLNLSFSISFGNMSFC